MGLRKFRNYLAVYKTTKKGETWEADFKEYQEAQAYINAKKDSDKYLIYEGYLAREEEVSFNISSGLKLEAIYKAETEKAINEKGTKKSSKNRGIVY